MIFALYEGEFLECFFPIAFNHNFWANEDPFGPMIENITSGREVKPFFSAQILSDFAISRHKSLNNESYIINLYEERFEHVLQIKELCKKNNSELIIYMLPLLDSLVERIDYDKLYYNKLKNFCDENNIIYYDFNKTSDTAWTYKYFRDQVFSHNTHLNVYGQTLASMQLANLIDNLSDSFTISDYSELNMRTIDFLYSIDLSNDLLIIDDCPKEINLELNQNVDEYLKNINVILTNKIATDNDSEKKDEPETYFISKSIVTNNYILPSNLEYTPDAISIYELDSSGYVLKYAITRWDEFDTVILR